MFKNTPAQPSHNHTHTHRLRHVEKVVRGNPTRRGGERETERPGNISKEERKKERERKKATVELPCDKMHRWTLRQRTMRIKVERGREKKRQKEREKTSEEK